MHELGLCTENRSLPADKQQCLKQERMHLLLPAERQFRQLRCVSGMAGQSLSPQDYSPVLVSCMQ